MKYEASRMAREKILTSWFYSSSVAPRPSVSSTSTLMGSPSGVKPSIGLPQIQTPYRQKRQNLIKTCEIGNCSQFKKRVLIEMAEILKLRVKMRITGNLQKMCISNFGQCSNTFTLQHGLRVILFSRWISECRKGLFDQHSDFIADDSIWSKHCGHFMLHFLSETCMKNQNALERTLHNSGRILPVFSSSLHQEYTYLGARVDSVTNVEAALSV